MPCSVQTRYLFGLSRYRFRGSRYGFRTFFTPEPYFFQHDFTEVTSQFRLPESNYLSKSAVLLSNYRDKLTISGGFWLLFFEFEPFYGEIIEINCQLAADYYPGQPQFWSAKPSGRAFLGHFHSNLPRPMPQYALESRRRTKERTETWSLTLGLN